MIFDVADSSYEPNSVSTEASFKILGNHTAIQQCQPAECRLHNSGRRREHAVTTLSGPSASQNTVFFQAVDML